MRGSLRSSEIGRAYLALTQSWRALDDAKRQVRLEAFAIDFSYPFADGNGRVAQTPR